MVADAYEDMVCMAKIEVDQARVTMELHDKIRDGLDQARKIREHSMDGLRHPLSPSVYFFLVLIKLLFLHNLSSFYCYLTTKIELG